MSNKKEKLNSKLKSNYSQKIKDYINRTESINILILLKNNKKTIKLYKKIKV